MVRHGYNRVSTLEAQRQNKAHRARPRPPFEQIALVLQGGGPLGAYQAGVYEALAEADLRPGWVAESQLERSRLLSLRGTRLRRVSTN